MKEIEELKLLKEKYIDYCHRCNRHFSIFDKVRFENIEKELKDYYRIKENKDYGKQR